MKKIQFTQDGYDKLSQEYDLLKKTSLPQALDRLQKARAMGDLKENSEYTAAKDDLAFVEGRIRELEDLLHNASIIQSGNDEGTIEIGCNVQVENNGKTQEFMIVGEFEADPMSRKLSHTSPIGSALLGKKKGEKVEVEVPAGKNVYTIINVTST